MNTPAAAPQALPWAHRAREALAQCDLALDARFDAGEPAHQLARCRAGEVERWLLDAWQQCLPAGSGLTLFAVGGFGRGSLYPCSDVDLLLVGDAAAQQAQEAAIAAFIARLWDARIEASHAVHDWAGITAAAAADVALLTSLMDARLLHGDAAATQALAAAIAAPGIWPAQAYFTAKREELRQRHARFGDTADNLEPNIKEGPGGLRDLQTLRWMALRLYAGSGREQLQALGKTGADEQRTLLQAATQLQRLRWGLHRVAGKREERLRFDYQRQLAARLLQVPEAGNADVERMMQAFYRSAGLVQRLSARLLQRFEEELFGEGVIQPLAEGFQLRGQWLADTRPMTADTAAERAFALFSQWARLPGETGLHSRSARQLAEHLGDIPPYHAASAAQRAAFVALLQEDTAITSLRRMAHAGVLGRWLPAFAGVTGRMQFDLFHVYTVDQHTLALLANLDAFARGSDSARFTLAHQVWPQLRKPALLVLAGLFHDIAKGRGGDHAELGADDARAFCLAHGFSEADTALVEWLVRQHLLMSLTAQKQDIHDREVVQQFARQMGSQERLDYLYLLTCADIAATSPKLWNAWKDRLLGDLYKATRQALQRGLDTPQDAAGYAGQIRAQVAADLREAGMAADAAQAWMARLPAAAWHNAEPALLLWQCQTLAAAPDARHHVAVRHFGQRQGGGLEVFVHSPDRDGLFAALVATLDRAGLAIQEARLMHGDAGDVFDTFQVLPQDARRPVDAAQVEAALRAVLALPSLAAVRAPKRSIPRQLRHFRLPTRVAFQPHPGGRGSVMQLVANDRPGLLAEVAAVIRAQGLRVHEARIATFGERVEDSFVLSQGQDAPLDASQQQALAKALGAHNHEE